jgi:hypothetical protein
MASTLYSDWIEEHHSIEEQAYSIGQHDYDVNDAKKIHFESQVFRHVNSNELTLRFVFLSVIYEQNVQT